jgi:hypothetical protein
MRKVEQRVTKKDKSITSFIWGFLEAFEFEILVCIIASLVWYTISALVRNG